MPEGRDGEQAPDAALAAPGTVHSQSGTHTVFISYASSDRAVADSVCAALERAGMNCWIAPRDVTPGELYSEAIVHAIDSAKVVVLVLSQNAAVSQHVLREVERASSKRHPVVSFRIDLAPLPAALEYFLNTSQWLDASAIGVERALPKLVHAVQRGVSHASDAAPSFSEGARSAARTDPDAAVTKQARQRSRLMLAALAAITAFALAYLVVDHFWLSKRVDEQKPSVAATPTSPANPSAGPAIPDKSIAVLPFADMSAEKNQEYMSDGIAEEILNLLAQVPDLKVIARTSSFAFKGEKVEITEIAKKLNVAHVLEGSVRKSGNKIRITAQLVRTADSTHLWSETYDRPLDDVFKIQDEIAGAIVEVLQIKFMGGNISRRAGGTQNLEAYQLYLRSLSEDTNTKSSIDAAEEYLKKAITLDPSYGLAWADLGNVIGIKTENGLLPSTEGWQEARRLTNHSLQLSPELSDAHAYLGYISLYYDWDWVAAKREAQRALAISPTDGSGLLIAGILSRTLGSWDEAERQLRAVLDRDPLATTAVFHLGLTYYLAGRFEESEGMYRHLLELDPTWTWAHLYLSKTLLAQGKPEAALATIQQETDEGVLVAGLPILLQAAGHQAEADKALQSLIEHWGDTGAYGVALTYAYRGDHARALEWLERAFQQKDVGLAEIVGEPLFKNLADDPRFKAILRKMNLPA